jgi:hypothetical protein
VRVYDLGAGKRISEYLVPDGGPLVAPPVLDDLGRLYAVTATTLEILDARTLRRTFDLPARIESRAAAVLHADGRLVVFHDGLDGTENLHFIDLTTGKTVRREAPALLRDVDVLRDGARLFVFTATPGVERTGARLFRVDLEGRTALPYVLPPPALAYARPLLVADYVATLGHGSRGASLRLFERDASAASAGPRPVFVDASGQETAEIDVAPIEPLRHAVPPGLAVLGEGLVAAHPSGAFQWAARDAR